MTQSKHHYFLNKALLLAERKKGFCCPNPSVGALIADKNGKIIAQGFHSGVGTDHAEINAFKKISHAPKESILYITLEPCSHYGKTPPCTDAIIQSGIKHVVFGYLDANPIVEGKSQAILNKAGIKCEYFPHKKIEEFYASYQYWHQHHKPFITAKLAMTLNGKIAGPKGERIQLTGCDLFIKTHQERKKRDAILTTSKTIVHDDPELNVRIFIKPLSKPIYILDRTLKISPNAKIFKTAQSVTLLHASIFDKEKLACFSANNIRCIEVAEDEDGLNLAEVICVIGKDRIQDLWLEAGGQIIQSFINKNLLQKMIIYLAPLWLSEGQDAFSEKINLHFKNIKWQQKGIDTFAEIVF